MTSNEDFTQALIGFTLIVLLFLLVARLDYLQLAMYNF